VIAFYMDEHVPRAVTDGLRFRGIDVLIAQDDVAEGTPDNELLDRATKLGRVLYTHDDDLIVEAARRQNSGEYFCGVIYVHQEKITIGQAVRDLEYLAQAGNSADFENQVIYLPL